MEPKLNILIVDDESSQRTGLAAMVRAWGMIAETAADGRDALEKLESFDADVVVTDLSMPRMDGHDLLKALRDAANAPPAIVVTAFNRIETALSVVHDLGAYWFVEKPVRAAELQLLIRRAATHKRLTIEKLGLVRQLQYKGSVGEMIGASPRMQEIYKAWVKQFLTTPDPYNGTTLAQEPAVAIFEIQNEDSLFFWSFDPAKCGQGPRKILEKKFFLHMINRQMRTEHDQNKKQKIRRYNPKR